MRNDSNPSQNQAFKIKVTAPWRLAEVTPLENFQLKVTFLDGLHGIVDLSSKIFSQNPGVFQKLQDPQFFNQVFLELGAVTWPGELDLAPDAMYEEIKKHGVWVLK